MWYAVLIVHREGISNNCNDTKQQAEQSCAHLHQDNSGEVVFLERTFANCFCSNLPGGNAQKQALLQLVDLAGSEKVDASHDPLRTAETKNINTSISALNLVVEQLVTKQPHISYRNSHLTKLLEGSLCGNAFVLIVCTITLDMGTEESTLSTLRFAGNAKRVDITCNTPKVGFVQLFSVFYTISGQ